MFKGHSFPKSIITQAMYFKFRFGIQGLLDMALTAGKRFKEPLSIVDKKINPNNDIK